MSDSQDASLVDQCLQGNRRAFEVLLDRYQRTVFNVVYRIVKDVEDAQDITQSTFVKAFENLRSFNPKYKFFSWIYKIAVNESLNHLNQRKRTTELNEDIVSEEDDPEGSLNNVDLSEKINDCLMKLSPEYRVVIVLRHFQDLPYHEIGQILDLPEKTVKSRLFAARQALRRHLMRKGL
ncbi:MAG TPA: sigma-70 family RNA polymerase sigma factor [Bacteroidota bacterium]|nr:sigma-70 family RNA polymerase sigma factor [Bacteroidota bacterium]